MTAIITVSSNAISIAGNTAGQPVYTYARINQVPPPPGKQEDKKADVLGAVGSVVSQAGIFNSGGRFAQATSQVTTLATGATLSVITRVSGIGVTATGVAQ